MDHQDVTNILLFLAAQTGSFIFFAGVLYATVRNHDKRIEEVEKLRNPVAQLAAKEGIQL